MNLEYYDSNDGENITILKEEYIELLKDSDLLRALLDAGVDSWDGYSIALDLLNNPQN
jgi:hypothetical protein